MSRSRQISTVKRPGSPSGQNLGNLGQPDPVSAKIHRKLKKLCRLAPRKIGICGGVIYMILHVHGPCTETVHVLAGFKLSARGVQTQRMRSSNSARGATTCCPPSTHPQCHLPRPVASPSRRPHRLHPCPLLVALAPRLPRPPTSPSCHPRRPRRSPSPHACLARLPHHHATLVAFALARCRSPSPHACLACSPHHHATHPALA